MSSKIIALVSLSVAALALSGCGDSGKTALGLDESNVLGIVKRSKASYEHTGPNTLALKTDELSARRDFSGNKTTYLWGLITVEDY